MAGECGTIVPATYIVIAAAIFLCFFAVSFALVAVDVVVDDDSLAACYCFAASLG